MRLHSALVGAFLSLALNGLVTSAASQEVSEEARQHFLAGVALLQDPAKPRYEEAYREFKSAYDISGSSKILSNLALCSMMLERDTEAVAYYEKYLAAATTLDPLERAQVQRDLLTLKVGVVQLEITVNPKGATLIDSRIPTQGEPITNVYGPVDGAIKIGVRQGHHVIKARLQGREEATWEFDAPGGTTKTNAFELKQPVVAPPQPVATTTTRPIPGLAIGLGTATLVVGATALVTGLFALDTQNTYGKRNDGTDPQGAANLKSTGQILNATTDALIGTAVLGAVITTIVVLMRPTIVKREAFTAPVSFRF